MPLFPVANQIQVARPTVVIAALLGALAAQMLPVLAASVQIGAEVTGVPAASLSAADARVELDGRDVTAETTFGVHALTVHEGEPLGDGEHVLELRIVRGSSGQRRFWYFIAPSPGTIHAVPFTASLGAIAPQPYPFAAARGPQYVAPLAASPNIPPPALYGCSLSPALAVAQTCISNAPGAPVRQPGYDPIRTIPPLHPNPYVIGPPASVAPPISPPVAR